MLINLFPAQLPENADIPGSHKETPFPSTQPIFQPMLGD